MEGERYSMGLTDNLEASPHSTLIRVHRSRIVEDGYAQLSRLSGNALKGLVRVKFVNEMVCKTSSTLLYCVINLSAKNNPVRGKTLKFCNPVACLYWVRLSAPALRQRVLYLSTEPSGSFLIL